MTREKAKPLDRHPAEFLAVLLLPTPQDRLASQGVGDKSRLCHGLKTTPAAAKDPTHHF